MRMTGMIEENEMTDARKNRARRFSVQSDLLWQGAMISGLAMLAALFLAPEGIQLPLVTSFAALSFLLSALWVVRRSRQGQRSEKPDLIDRIGALAFLAFGTAILVGGWMGLPFIGLMGALGAVAVLIGVLVVGRPRRGA